MGSDSDSLNKSEIIEGNRVREALRPPLNPGDPVGYGAIEAYVSIDPADLETEFLEAPEILARFVEVYTLAEGAHLRVKFLHDQTEARLHIQWREKLIRRAQLTQNRERSAEEVRWKATGDPKSKKQEIKIRFPTVTDVAAAVMVDPVYEEVRLADIMAEVEAKRLKGFCDAARVKRDMLTNIGMRHNAELRVKPLDVANARHPDSPVRSGGFSDYPETTNKTE